MREKRKRKGIKGRRRKRDIKRTSFHIQELAMKKERKGKKDQLGFTFNGKKGRPLPIKKRRRERLERQKGKHH